MAWSNPFHSFFGITNLSLFCIISSEKCFIVWTQQAVGVNSRLPRVSYIKAVDIWMGVCLIQVKDYLTLPSSLFVRLGATVKLFARVSNIWAFNLVWSYVDLISNIHVQNTSNLLSLGCGRYAGVLHCQRHFKITAKEGRRGRGNK